MEPNETLGVLASQQIQKLMAQGGIAAETEVRRRQVQPASLDLRLGCEAHRLQASFLPGREATVAAKLKDLAMTTIPLDEPTVLEKGCVYLVELQERVQLAEDLRGRANPKSTTGRLDVFTRIITDRCNAFEEVANGYAGPLYAEIMPRTFPVIVQAGTCLSQLRLIRNESRTLLDDEELRELERTTPLVFAGGEPEAAAIDRGIRLSVNLHPESAEGPVAYRGRYNAPIVDMAGTHRAEDYWERIDRCPNDRLILNPGDFYILASREQVRVPPAYAAEMVPFDPSVGELRIHYAGFFDPGFGYGDGRMHGTRAVLEVRAHDTPFIIEHGQVLGRLEYSRMAELPDRQYGRRIGSSYQNQGLALGKQFKA